MIIVSLGNPGSGKTASIVREMVINNNQRTTYSNILPKVELPYLKTISPDMIVKRELVETKTKKSGEVVPVYKHCLNVDFWREIKEPINVVLDEAHTIVNARRSMSKVNVIVNDWLALIRRVLGSGDAGYGQLVLISQLHNRIDLVARDMATQIRYHVCHYMKSCKDCLASWSESSENPEPRFKCPNCSGVSILKHEHVIEVWHFSNIDMYLEWKELGQKTFYRHYYIRDIEKYFPYYDTLQWDNMFSDII